ncbi:hypothetical protein SDC9_146169 [bioreactor metagenome]|uniref:Uncharacterized protein n=1 Tax=bioreactor metagenome TaxID=1076179 RepID=A0A645ECC5_9ZZZZ
MQRADIGRNRHLVIVEDHDQRHIRTARIVQPFKRHSSRQRTVANQRDGDAVLTAELLCTCQTKRRGNCRRRMPGIEMIVNAFFPFGEAGKAVFLPECAKRLPAPGDDLMRIGLMPDIEYNLVRGAVKRAMHGDCHLDNAEAGGKMPAATRDVFNHILAHLRRENGQFA